MNIDYDYLYDIKKGGNKNEGILIIIIYYDFIKGGNKNTGILIMIIYMTLRKEEIKMKEY